LMKSGKGISLVYFTKSILKLLTNMNRRMA
jgi:hypothetical protein